MRKPKVRKTPEEVEVGEFFNTYVCGGRIHYLSCAISKDAEGNFYTTSWGEDRKPFTEKVDYFERDMNWDEEKVWYKEQFDIYNTNTFLSITGLLNSPIVHFQNHQLDNFWISSDLYELIYKANERKYIIEGISDAPYQGSFFDYAVALVFRDLHNKDCTYEWCHIEKADADKLIEEAKEILRPKGFLS